jgi:subtilisin family serine protease
MLLTDSFSLQNQARARCAWFATIHDDEVSGSIAGQLIVSAKSDGSTRGGPALCSSADLLGNAGTSMATPLAAGAAALVRQYYTDGFYSAGVANAVSCCELLLS